MTVRFSRWAAGSLGFFTIATQVALIREFLIPFGGSELAFGTFFAAWFAWIALGATAMRRVPALHRVVLRHRWPLLSLQPLAGLLGVWAIPWARMLSGIPAYEPVPPGVLGLAALLSTAPVCLWTGLVFPAVCEGAAEGSRTGASIGYALEAAGAVVGGLASALAIQGGLGGSGLVVLGGLPLAALGAVGALGRRHRRALGLLPGIAWVLVAAVSLGDAYPRMRLRASLPQAEWVRDIETPYQALTEARMPGQTVLLTNGEVAASFPPGPGEEGIGALLATLPANRNRALVIGQDGLLLATRLARVFPVVQCVVRDPVYGEQFRQAWVRTGSGADLLDRVVLVTADERDWVQRLGQKESGSGRSSLDLVVIAGGEPTTLLANRLYTVEFLEVVRRLLAPGGVVAVPVRSGENALGTEERRYGQSVWQTLQAIWESVTVVPGDRAVLIASDQPVALDPWVLADRYRSIVPSPPPFPPEAFVPMLPPDRIALATTLYGEAPRGLVNRDDRPLASMLHLLARLRESDSALVGVLSRASRAGPWWLAAILAVLAVAVLRERVRRDSDPEGFAASLLLGVVGGTSITTHALLLTTCQARLGAIHGEIALWTSASMAGLALGSYGAHRWAGAMGPAEVRRRSLGYALVTAGLLALAPGLLAALGNSRWGFGLAFLTAGLVTGGAWPLAAGLAPGSRVAARLEAADHWGAMVLSGVGGVFCLAVFGTATTFRALAGLVVIPAILLVADDILAPGRSFRGHRLWRSLASPAFPWRWAPAVATVLTLGALLLWHASREPDPRLSSRLSLGDLRRIEAFSAATPQEDPFPHHRLEGLGTPPATAVAASSQAVAPDVQGYGGPLNLALSIGEDGRIRGAAVIAHHETPSYVRGLPTLMEALRGRDARHPLSARDLGEIDAMTGATVTRDAVLAALDRTRAALAGKVLGLPAEGATPEAPWWHPLLDARVFFVIASLLAALWVHLRGGPRARLLLLGVSAVGGGILFNLQVSATWLASLARFQWPSWQANAALAILSAGVLLLAALLGPLYCAHLCPFGALQEITSRISGRLHWIGRPSPGLSRVARSLKYGVLVLVVLSLFSPRPEGALAFDPLAVAFSGHPEGPGAWIAAAALVGSLLAFRFWCRVFCPVGAFLNLGNRLAGWLGLGPRRSFGACDLDVQGPHDLECLRCNRCVPGVRSRKAPPEEAEP
ncbi:MAG TPA: 4Fe-4S binding protein [Myxococcota bacterium]|nr:4Fe-4S binding protein [Myxococcota bacterium]HQK50600.1 4Fe-4S binding protein [Myxococcota bacterium]